MEIWMEIWKERKVLHRGCTGRVPFCTNVFSRNYSIALRVGAIFWKCAFRTETIQSHMTQYCKHSDTTRRAQRRNTKSRTTPLNPPLILWVCAHMSNSYGNLSIYTVRAPAQGQPTPAHTHNPLVIIRSFSSVQLCIQHNKTSAPIRYATIYMAKCDTVSYCTGTALYSAE